MAIASVIVWAVVYRREPRWLRAALTVSWSAVAASSAYAWVHYGPSQISWPLPVHVINLAGFGVFLLLVVYVEAKRRAAAEDRGGRRPAGRRNL